MAGRVLPTLQDVYLARSRIAPQVLCSPIYSIGTSLGLSGNIVLKCEFLQNTGTFKIRGAANKILGLPVQTLQRGVVTVSTGNHGRAVAAVASNCGIPAILCVSKMVPAYKLALFEQSGAELIVTGENQDQAARHAFDLARARGMTLVHPFDDPQIIAGQGTIGLELLEQVPQIVMAIVPIGGGGLISGIALALKAANPRIRVVGVQMERNPVMYHSQKAGKPIELEELPTLADSLGGGIFLDNAYTFAMVRDYVDEIVLVSEGEIAAAMSSALRKAHFVLEGAGAVGLAALRSGKIAVPAEGVTAVIASGGNVAIERLMRAVRSE